MLYGRCCCGRIEKRAVEQSASKRPLNLSFSVRFRQRERNLFYDTLKGEWIRMRNVEQALEGLHGRNHNRILCLVVSAGLARMPEEVLLGDLCAEAAEQLGKRPGAVYKALTRTAHDIWEHGDRQELERLMGYRQAEEPSAKELVTALVRSLWQQEPHVEYGLQEGGLERKVGICCRAADGETCIMSPFSRNREAVLALIDRWNREQLPMEQFRDMILLGQLRDQD